RPNRGSRNDFAVNRITRQLFTTNRLTLNADTVKLTNSRLTKIDGRDDFMVQFNRLPTRASVLPLLSNIPSIRTRSRNRGQILFRRGCVGGASPTIMRLIIRQAISRIAVEIR